MLPETTKLGDVVTFKGGGTPDKTRKQYWDGDIPWLSVKDLNRKYINVSGDYITQEGLQNSSACLVPSGSIIVATRMAVGRLAISSVPLAINQDLKYLISSKDVRPEYIYFLLEFKAPLIEKRASGSTVKGVNVGVLKNLLIYLPPLPEQKKIAAILSTWDEAIEGTERLLANSRQQKKALMQQLLTGKTRLPGFEGAWESASFDDVFLVKSTRKSQVNKSEYKEEGDIPVIDQGAYLISGYADIDLVYDEIPVIIFGDHTRVVKWVDFLFRPGADGAKILHCREHVVPKYGYYSLSNTVIPNLGYSRHMKELREKFFLLPPLPEQKAIAAMLTTADGEIEALEKDLTRLRAEKKALMQQLLTGRRRVKVV